MAKKKLSRIMAAAEEGNRRLLRTGDHRPLDQLPEKPAPRHRRHHSSQKSGGLTLEEKCGAVVIILAFFAALYFILIS